MNNIYYNFDDAFHFAHQFIINLNNSIHYSLTNKKYIHPNELYHGPWEQSIDSLSITLDYIFNYLHHNCYMLCTSNNNFYFSKLQSSKTSPFIKPILMRQLNNLKFNDKLTNKQKEFIRNIIHNNEIRVMQCIVKKFEPPNFDENEYTRIFKNIKLPDGVFIFNLTDAIILKKNGTNPWDMVFHNSLLPNKYKNKKFLPIFSMSGHKDYWDIPIPTYDDLMDLPKHIITNWSKKTINKALFRGGPTGCGYTPETNMRLKIATIHSPLLDAGLVTNNKFTLNSKSIRIDPKYGIGMLNTNIKPANYISYPEQSLYKYIVFIDGNVHAYRLLTVLSFGSLILRVHSPYTSWADSILKPNVHYISIKSDLSDLLNIIQYCIHHDSICHKIAKEGMKIANQLLNIKYIQTSFQDSLWIPFSSFVSTSRKTKRKRCPNGSRKDPKHPNLCIPFS